MVGAGIDSILEIILLIYWRSHRLYSTYWWVFKYPLLRLPHATCVSKQWESDKYGPFRLPCKQSSAMVTTIQSHAACEGEQRISLGGIAGVRCLNINCDSSMKTDKGEHLQFLWCFINPITFSLMQPGQYDGTKI